MKQDKKSVNIITLGCSKNLVDSEKIMGQLPADRFHLSHDASGPADIVIINTCGFIHDAKEESINTILEYVEAKKQGLVQEVLVTGCLSQRYKEELPAEIPEADAWFGVQEPFELFEYLKQKYDTDNTERLVSTPSHYAYLKISEGCNRTCSFCAIPLIRGAYASRTIDSLVAETRQLAAKGVKELLLVAQDLSYYGYDLEGKSLLAPLLEALSAIEGIQWIRLHYAYPQNFPKDVIPLMASNHKICRYLDIPLQHINDKVLKAMRRGHNKKNTLELLEQFRQQIPGVALRTTLMVGFPGETHKEFEELLEFVRQARFERLGVFAYSPEEGTTAFQLGDPVSEKVKQQRVDILMSLQADISATLNEQKIGKTFRVLIDRREGNFLVARSEFDSPEVDNEVLVEPAAGIEPGMFADVVITSATDFELFAQVK
ncbi:MAG: 30S ribosomal protein S12 methylthiotransferase RimO [Bacteroidales bacterium]